MSTPTPPATAPRGTPVTASAELGGPVRHRYHLLVAFAGIGFGLTAPFTALLVIGLGGPAQWAAYVVASMGLSLLVVDLLGTRVVPRLGSRGALTASMLIFAAGSAFSAATTDWEVVGLARVLQGFGTALFMGGGVLLAVRLVGGADRGAAIGTFNAAWFVGIAVGPLGGGLIAATVPGPDGLRLLFAVCAAVNLAGAVVAWFWTPRWRSELPPRIGPPRDLGIRGRRAWAALVLAGLGQAVRSGVALTLVPLFGEQLGLGWVWLGVALFAMAVCDVGVMHLGAGWADRRGRSAPLALALGWGALLTLAMATVVHDGVGFTLAALAIGVTIGASWVLPAAMVVDLAEGRPDGALAAYRIASDVGMLAGGLLAGVGIAVGGIGGALLGTTAMLAAGLVLVLAVGETLPRAPSVVLPVPRPTPPPEVPVPLPPIDDFAVFAVNQDIVLTPERLAQAHAAHAEYRADLERLRALPLTFTEPVTEPATATAWIAGGGRS